MLMLQCFSVSKRRCSLAACPESAASGTSPGIAACLAISTFHLSRPGLSCILEPPDALCNIINLSRLLMCHGKKGQLRHYIKLHSACVSGRARCRL